MGGISWLAQSALDFLIEERCHSCGDHTGEAGNHDSTPALAAPVIVFSVRSFRLETRLLCVSCAAQVNVWPGPVLLPLSSQDALARVYPVFVTDERLLAVIHLLKFGRRERIASWLARAMTDRLPDFAFVSETGASNAEKPVVVPVPMDRASRMRRGFNQAERIARPLARHWSLPIEPRALTKIRHTRAQSTLGRDERLANLKDAFRADRERVNGASVILVDDLVTTGATVRACASALRAAGARKVVAVCVGYRDEGPGPGRFLNLDNDFRSE
jgi:ComF family protein